MPKPTSTQWTDQEWVAFLEAKMEHDREEEIKRLNKWRDQHPERVAQETVSQAWWTLGHLIFDHGKNSLIETNYERLTSALEWLYVYSQVGETHDTSIPQE